MVLYVLIVEGERDQGKKDIETARILSLVLLKTCHNAFTFTMLGPAYKSSILTAGVPIARMS